MCTRATAPLCVYPCFCYRSCRRRSCQCGLHKQAARAKVARSSAQPKGLRSASRRPWSALQLHAPASRRVPHSVSQPAPPHSRTAPASAYRRPGLSNSVAPAARKRSASAATGASFAVTLRTAPCPLRSLALPTRSLRGLRKPRSGSCSAGARRTSRPRAQSHTLTHPTASNSRVTMPASNLLKSKGEKRFTLEMHQLKTCRRIRKTRC